MSDPIEFAFLDDGLVDFEMIVLRKQDGEVFASVYNRNDEGKPVPVCGVRELPVADAMIALDAVYEQYIENNH